MKKTIRLRESELRRMIAESVKRVLNEEIDYRSVSDWNDDLSNTDDLYDYDETLGNAKENLRMQGVSASLHHPTTTPWASDDPDDLGSMDSLDVLYAKPDELERRVNKQKTQVYPSGLEESIRNSIKEVIKKSVNLDNGEEFEYDTEKYYPEIMGRCKLAMDRLSAQMGNLGIIAMDCGMAEKEEWQENMYNAKRALESVYKQYILPVYKELEQFGIKPTVNSETYTDWGFRTNK
jgi:hypothetical protein